jgi:hypothetical protein
MLASACVQENITSIKLPGQGEQVYEFSYNIKETVQIPVNNADAIKELMDNNEVYAFVFDGSDETDNGRFRVAVINIVTKLTIYYNYERYPPLTSDNFRAFYFINNGSGTVWYDSNDQVIQAPVFSGPVIWFKGPNTGANETSVRVNGNIIYVSGSTGRDIERAADRFVLAIFGINK